MGFKQEWLSETFWLMAFSTGIVATGTWFLYYFEVTHTNFMIYFYLVLNKRYW